MSEKKPVTPKRVLLGFEMIETRYRDCGPAKFGRVVCEAMSYVAEPSENASPTLKKLPTMSTSPALKYSASDKLPGLNIYVLMGIVVWFSDMTIQ